MPDVCKQQIGTPQFHSPQVKMKMKPFPSPVPVPNSRKEASWSECSVAARLAWCHPQGRCKGLHQGKVGISSVTSRWWSILYFVNPFPTIVCTETRCRHCSLGRLESSPLVSSLRTLDPWKQKFIMKFRHMKKEDRFETITSWCFSIESLSCSTAVPHRLHSR